MTSGTILDEKKALFPVFNQTAACPNDWHAFHTMTSFDPEDAAEEVKQ